MPPLALSLLCDLYIVHLSLSHEDGTQSAEFFFNSCLNP